jgi:lysozyme
LNPYIRDLLVRDEGVRLKPYMDTAKPPRITIGCGRNLTDVGISADECEGMLAADIAHVENQAHTFPWYAALNEARQAVILSLLFNMGLRTLLTFTNTLKLIETGKYAEAADAMEKSLWAKQVGDRAKRLSEMMRSGVLVRR